MLPDLTDRENEVFDLLGDGKTMKEIAHALGIKYKTVNTICDHIRDKLGEDGKPVKSAYALAVLAIKEKFSPISGNA